MSDRAKARRVAGDFFRLFDQLAATDDDAPSDDDAIVAQLRRVRGGGASIAETIIVGIEADGLRRRYMERGDDEALELLINLVESAAEYDDLHPTGKIAEFFDDLHARGLQIIGNYA